MSDTICDMCGWRCIPIREWLVTSASKTDEGTNDGRPGRAAHDNKGDSSKPTTVRLRVSAMSADMLDGNVCLSCLRTAIHAAAAEMDGLISAD